MKPSVAEGCLGTRSLDVERECELPVMEKLAAYIELTKPRLSFLILLVVGAGFWLGSGELIDIRRLMDTMALVSLLAGGMFALNQYLERDLDRLMRRTATRPLPAGRLAGPEALWFGVALCGLSVVGLAVCVNVASALIAVLTLCGYLFLYTPLKTRSPHSTLVGAFPGATPPLLGWTAARGELTVEAWVLFAILFLWQFPHFHSIGWLYSDDYAKANVRLWSVIEPNGSTVSKQVVGFTSLLLPVSLLPWVFGVSGGVYLVGAAVLGAAFLALGIRASVWRSKWQARRLLLASVLYLPVLFVLMVLDK